MSILAFLKPRNAAPEHASVPTIPQAVLEVMNKATDCIQPCDLVLNHILKAGLRKRFADYVTSQLLQQMKAGKTAADCNIDLTLRNLKELQVKWTKEVYDEIPEAVLAKGWRIAFGQEAAPDESGEEMDIDVENEEQGGGGSEDEEESDKEGPEVVQQAIGKRHVSRRTPIPKPE